MATPVAQSIAVAFGPTSIIGGAAAAEHEVHEREVNASPLIKANEPLRFKKVAHRLMKAALTAILLRLLIGVLKSLGKYKLSVRTLRAIRDEVFGLDPWKWACVFVGWAAFRPLYKLLEDAARPLLAPHIGADNVAHVATVAAAAIAAQPVRVMMMSTRLELGLYLASRASHSLATAFILPRLPRALYNFNHWDVFFVGLSGAQILYGVVFEPGTHLPSYRTFLENCVMLPRNLLDTVAGYHRRQLTPQTLQRFDAVGRPWPADTSDMTEVCKVLHPNHGSCNTHALWWVGQHMMRFSIPLYLPLKIITTLAFGWRKVLRDPLGQLWKIVKSVTTSSLFLSLYCCGPLRVMCLFNQLGVRNPGLFVVPAGIACSLPTLLEPKGRRLDLALYCNMHAIRSLILLLARRGIIGRPRGVHVMMLYTAAVTVLLHFLRFRPQDLHPNLRSGLQFIIGK
jgi:hypothetical protein